MLRLAHRILGQRDIGRDDLGVLFSDDGFYSVKDAQMLFQRVRTNLSMNIPVVIADNVAVHWNELCKVGKVASTADWKNVPSCPPAFSRCFIEWNCPEVKYSRHFGQLHEFNRTNKIGFKQGGVLLQVNGETEDSDFAPWMGAFHTKEAIDVSRWQIIGVILGTQPNGRATVLGRMGLMLDETGTIIERRMESMFEPLLDEHFPVVTLTLAFMQCKNVEKINVTDLEGPPPGWRENGNDCHWSSTTFSRLTPTSE